MITPKRGFNITFKLPKAAAGGDLIYFDVKKWDRLKHQKPEQVELRVTKGNMTHHPQMAALQ